MLRHAVIAATLIVLLPAAPSLALTPKEKMETCKIGAEHQKLAGKERKKFMAKCMSNKDEPRGPAGSGAPPPKQ